MEQQLGSRRQYYRGLDQRRGLVHLFACEGGAYYQAMGPSAELLASRFFGSQSMVRLSDGIPTLSVSRKYLARVLGHLVEQSMDIRIHEMLGTAGWRLQASASPGSLAAIAHLLPAGGVDDSRCIACVVAEQTLNTVRYGVATFNTLFGVLSSGEWSEAASDEAADGQHGHLEGILTAMSVKETHIALPGGQKESVDELDPSALPAGSGSSTAAAAAAAAGCVVRGLPSKAFDGASGFEWALSASTPDAGTGEVARGAAAAGASEAASAALSMDGATARPASAADLSGMPLALRACGALCRVAGGEAGGMVAVSSVRRLQPGASCRLDAAAVAALRLLPTSRRSAATPAGTSSAAASAGGQPLSTLFGMLNQCVTGMGARCLRRWLVQPSTSAAAIGWRLDVVEALVNNVRLRDQVRGTHLRGVPDGHWLSQRLRLGAATLRDVLAVYRMAAVLGALAKSLEQHAPEAGAIHPIAQLATRLQDGDARLALFRRLVEQTVDVEGVRHRRFRIRPNVHPGLERLERELAEGKALVEAARVGAAELLGLDHAKVSYQRGSVALRPHLRLPVKQQKALYQPGGKGKGARGSKQTRQGLSLLSVQRDGAHFTTPALERAVSRVAQLTAEYETAQSAIVAEVVRVSATYAPVLEEVSASLAALDALAAFAELAATASTPYCRPVLVEPGDEAPAARLELRGLRHPLVELAVPAGSFVANDLVLGGGATASTAAVVTGPNMGGKSTYIRSVALAFVMAQCGCFVPAASARLPIVDGIFARVGATDRQLEGVSSFMAEMLEVGSLLRGVTPRSLVIMDEIGRGTSTTDGLALAWSVMDHLVRRVGCHALVATHFHRLPELLQGAGVQPLRMSMAVRPAEETAAGQEVVMLYRVEEGVCDDSFGLHVARVAGMPGVVLEEAVQLMAGGGSAVATGSKRRQPPTPLPPQQPPSTALAPQRH